MTLCSVTERAGAESLLFVLSSQTHEFAQVDWPLLSPYESFACITTSHRGKTNKWLAVILQDDDHVIGTDHLNGPASFVAKEGDSAGADSVIPL